MNSESIQEVLSLIPQRPPFLFVDQVIKREEGSIVTRKKLTGEEDFFKGHFPGNPVMPGVLLQEATFQTGALLMAGLGESEDEIGVVTKVENARFKSFVRPGDELVIEVKLLENLENAFYMQGKITVEGKVVASLKFTCAKVTKQ